MKKSTIVDAIIAEINNQRKLDGASSLVSLATRLLNNGDIDKSDFEKISKAWTTRYDNLTY